MKKKLLILLMTLVLFTVTCYMPVSEKAKADNTEETAPYINVVKSKEDLKVLLDCYSTKFREETIYDYATSDAIAMLNALDFGDTVWAAGESDWKDYSAAYYMITEAANKLKLYSTADVKSLVSSCKKVYESDNVLNESHNDSIYLGTLYEDFTSAYEDADGLTSSDSNEICSAYVELKNAYDALTDAKLPTVSKTEFAAQVKVYDKIIENSNKYESWRRGTASAEVDNKRITAGTANGQPLTYGDLLGSDNEVIDLMSGTPIHSLDALEGALAKYDELWNIKETSKTSDTAIVAAYQDLKRTCTLISSFTPDSYSSARKANVTSLVLDNREQIIQHWVLHSEDIANPSDNPLEMEIPLTVEDLKLFITTQTETSEELLFDNAVPAANMKLSSNAPTIYISYDSEDGSFLHASTVEPSDPSYKIYRANQTIPMYRFINLKYGIINHQYASIPTDLQNALLLYYEYESENYVSLSDYTNSVISSNGSAAEYSGSVVKTKI